jgi:chorismate mutase
LCGEECKPKDSKNPRRWVVVRKCTTVGRGSNITFKQQLRNLCDERQDQWANEVMARVSVVIDLHAVDAQYHVPCYERFRVVPVTCPFIIAPVEDALRSVRSTMAKNATENWTTSELYSMYLAASGTVSRRQLVSTITAYFGDELLMLHIEGCDSVVGFKDSLGQFIKIIKTSKSQGDDDALEKLVMEIRSVVMATPRPGDYNLGAYIHHKIIERIRATLLKLVSSLVSGVTSPRHH